MATEAAEEEVLKNRVPIEDEKMKVDNDDLDVQVEV